jgi:hypothetical protein
MYSTSPKETRHNLVMYCFEFFPQSHKERKENPGDNKWIVTFVPLWEPL